MEMQIFSGVNDSLRVRQCNVVGRYVKFKRQQVEVKIVLFYLIFFGVPSALSEFLRIVVADFKADLRKISYPTN